MRHLVGCVLVLSFLMLIGCGSSQNSPSYFGSRAKTRERKESPRPNLYEPGNSSSEPNLQEGKRFGGEPAPQAKAPEQAAKEQTIRKVIYNASMTVTVKNIDEAGDALNDLVVKFQGYVVEANVTGSVGTRRHGLWKARIPVASYDAFRLAVKKLGITEKSASDSKDVSEEFYDTKARIDTLKSEEKSLMQLLETLAKNYSESKEVRRDLWQVREKIEQLEGRMNYLDKLTAMTTFTITLQEEQQRYVAPDPPLTPPPSFPDTIHTTFQTSLDLLTTVGKFVTLVFVALAPWLPLLLVVGLLSFVLYRRHRHTRPALAQSGTGTPPPDLPNPSPPA
jgi:hypothetical protein